MVVGSYGQLQTWSAGIHRQSLMWSEGLDIELYAMSTCAVASCGKYYHPGCVKDQAEDMRPGAGYIW